LHVLLKRLIFAVEFILKEGTVGSLFLFYMPKQAVITEKIKALLLEKFQEEEYADCFIVEVTHHQNNKLEVFIDSDSGITFKKCQRISRFLEQYIDEEAWLGEKYTLEVSSPGIGRPLKFIRQYHRNLVACDETNITTERMVTTKQGKKKKKEMVQTVIPFEDIAQTKVKITF